LSLGPARGRSTEGDESARESKHAKVVDDGQSDEENNVSEEENNACEEEENRESEERRTLKVRRRSTMKVRKREMTI
jgi:hypothetical protein